MQFRFLPSAVLAAAAMAQAAPAHAEWVFHATRYALLSPPDYERDERWLYTDKWTGDAKVTFVTCAPGADVRINGATLLRRDVQEGAYYLTTFAVPLKKKRFVYSARAGTKEQTGSGFYLAAYPETQPFPISQLVTVLPVCRPPRTLTQEDIDQRFGALAARAGTSNLAANRTWAIDYEWYIPGRVMATFHRNWGKSWGATSMIAWDDKAGALRFQKIVGNLDLPEGAIPASYLNGKPYPLQADKRMKNSSGSGGGFLAAATGAIMGAATGYAKSGGSSVGAITGAMGGAVVGKAGGNDALYQEMEATRAQATADAEASQRQLQRTIAQAQRQGAGAGVGSGGSGAAASSASAGGAAAVAAPVSTSASASASSGVKPWQVEVWCTSTSVKRWKESQTLGSRTIEADHSKVTMYKSQVFPMTITDLGEVNGASAQWRSYLDARQLPYEKAGCESGGRKMFDSYVVGVRDSGQTVSEVIQTDFRM